MLGCCVMLYLCVSRKSSTRGVVVTSVINFQLAPGFERTKRQVIPDITTDPWVNLKPYLLRNLQDTVGAELTSHVTLSDIGL